MNTSIYTFNNIVGGPRGSNPQSSNPHSKGVQNGGDMMDNSSKLSGSVKSNNKSPNPNRNLADV